MDAITCTNFNHCRRQGACPAESAFHRSADPIRWPGDIVLRQNPVARLARCAQCGGEFEVPAGMCLTVGCQGRLVCWDCAHRHAPRQVRMWQMIRDACGGARENGRA